MIAAHRIIGKLLLVLLALCVFRLAIEAKRSQYPDSASNNPHLASAIKMAETRGSRCVEAIISAALWIQPVLVPVARAVARPEPILPKVSASQERLQFRPPPSL